MEQMKFVQQAGMVVLGSLMLLVFYNDIMRLFGLAPGFNAPYMITLAIDTAGYAGGVAILDNYDVIGEISFANRRTHSHNLMRSIERVMELSGVEWSDVGLMAVSIGPGSFTGLRIGLSTVKGIAFAKDIPVCGVPTLDARALEARGVPGEVVCPIVDARKKQVFTASYLPGDMEEIPQRISDYMVLDPEELSNILPQDTGCVVVYGTGFEEYRERIISCLKLPWRSVPSCLSVARASSTGFVALSRMMSGKSPDNPAALVPFYIRPSEAEIARQRAELPSA
jgi:tRNA threonylcarbamoyladenosine biosynthesis protein TsaB